MKKETPIITQLSIFISILFVSNIISSFFPSSFPVPTPLIGLVLLYLLLTTKVIKVSQVEKVGDFFIGILAFLFIPSGIQLAPSLDVLSHDGVKIVGMTIFSTIVLLVVIASTTSIIIHIKQKISSNNQ